MSTSSSASVTPKEAAERLSRGEIELVDVREPDEWRAGHAPGARHIPLADLPAHLDDLAGNGPVAFVCQAGGRSKAATDLAGGHGIQALNVDGGMLAWQDADLDVTRDDSHGA